MFEVLECLVSVIKAKIFICTGIPEKFVNGQKINEYGLISLVCMCDGTVLEISKP